MVIPPSNVDIIGGDTSKSAKFRSMLDFFNSYAENMVSFIWHQCGLLIKESEAIKEEFGGIWVEDYDDRYSKNADEDDGFDFGNAFYKEELEYSFEEKRDEAEMYAENYPQIFFGSLFITIFSLFENYLNHLCDDAHKRDSLSLTFKDLRGGGIRRALKYLKKEARLEFSLDTEEWRHILLLIDIRNNLVHKITSSYDPFDEKEVNPKLRDYFWLEDHSFDDLFEEIDRPVSPMMFSVGSIKNVIRTLSNFVKYIDEPLEKRDQRRHKFRKGPKHKR